MKQKLLYVMILLMKLKIMNLYEVDKNESVERVNKVEDRISKWIQSKLRIETTKLLNC